MDLRADARFIGQLLLHVNPLAYHQNKGMSKELVSSATLLADQRIHPLTVSSHYLCGLPNQLPFTYFQKPRCGLRLCVCPEISSIYKLAFPGQGTGLPA